MKNKESQVFFVCKNALLERKRVEKMRKGRSSRKEKTVFVRFFFGENLRRRIFKHKNLFLQHFGLKKANTNLFCFWKINKRIQRREVSTIESTNKVFFLQKKRRYCVPIFSKVFSTLWKIDIGKWHKENRFRKDVTKKESKGEKKVVEMRRHWSGSSPKSQFTQHNSH